MPKITDFTTETNLDSSELFPIIKAGANKKTAMSTIFDWLTKSRKLVTFDDTNIGLGYVNSSGVPVDITPFIISGFYNVKNSKYAGGAKGNGTNDDTAAIQAAIDAVPHGSVWNDPRISEGGTVYLPRGKYKITSTLDLSSSETLGGRRQGLHLKGDGMNATIIYSDTVKNMILANTAVDYLSLSDLSIITYANFTGAGTIEKVVDLISCLNVRMTNVKIYVRSPGKTNPDCILLNMENCYYSLLDNCETMSFSYVSSDLHNISGAANAKYYSSTHIRSKINNAFYIRDHKFSNPYRGLHSIADDGGIVVKGGAIESYTQGFLFEEGNGNRVENIRCESHPENVAYQQYLGNGEQYTIKFTETTQNCVFSGYGYFVQSDVTNGGFHNYGLNNNIFFNNFPLFRPNPTPLIKNGDFAIAPFGATPTIPGWLISGTPTITTVTNDLPPEAGIDRVLSIASTANQNGIKAVVDIDVQRISGIALKYWHKRTAGNSRITPQLYHPATSTTIMSDMTSLQFGSQMTMNRVSPTVTPTWSGGLLTIVTPLPNHFLKTGQLVKLASFTASINNWYAVTVVDAKTFTIAMSDPGTIGTGTFQRYCIEDVIEDLNVWNKFTNRFSLRRNIVSITGGGGSNVVITFNINHYIPNNASAQVKLYGLNSANYNGVFNVISTTNTTVTIADPGGSLPTPNNHGTGRGSVVHYGWGGLHGTIQVMLVHQLFTGFANTTSLVGGVVCTDIVNDVPNVYKSPLTQMAASKSWTPGTVVAFAAGATQSTTITVPGAVVGDDVVANFSVYNAGLIYTGQVSAADTVTVMAFNTTNATITPGAGTLTVTVSHLN